MHILIDLIGFRIISTIRNPDQLKKGDRGHLPGSSVLRHAAVGHFGCPGTLQLVGSGWWWWGAACDEGEGKLWWSMENWFVVLTLFGCAWYCNVALRYPVCFLRAALALWCDLNVMFEPDLAPTIENLGVHKPLQMRKHKGWHPPSVKICLRSAKM